MLIHAVRTRDKVGDLTDTVSMGERLVVEIDVEGLREFRGSQVAVIIKSDTGQWLSNFNTGMKPPAGYEPREAIETVTLDLPVVPYVTGNYFMDISVAQKGVGRLDAVENAIPLHVTDNDVYGSGYSLSHKEGVVYLNGDWSIQPKQL